MYNHPIHIKVIEIIVKVKRCFKIRYRLRTSTQAHWEKRIEKINLLLYFVTIIYRVDSRIIL